MGDYRERIFYGLAIAGALFLLPFSVNNFLQGRVVLGTATTVVVAAFLANAVAIYFGRRPPVPAVVAFLPVVAALVLSVRTQGLIGVLWTYPALILFHFVLGRRLANLFNLVVVALVIPLADSELGHALTARIGVTLVLTILFTNIFSSIVGSLQRRLHAMAIRDPLTGAFNRRYLDTCLDEALERHRRYGTEASLLVLDVDHFKGINDELGHGAGDQVLQEVVETIRSRLRRLDVLFRSGGEEFVILLPDSGGEGARHVAEGLRAGIAEARLLDGRVVTVSLGVSDLGPRDDRESWMRRCDRALYEAKSSGRNRVAFAPAPSA